MHKANKYLSNTYYALDISSRVFSNFQRSFIKMALQETTAQTDQPGKCQPKKHDYFNQI